MGSTQTQSDAAGDYEADKRIAERLKEFLNKKVNALNAFDTPILEGLSSAVKVETLQCVGAMLDASAKCYAYRVDNTFGACYKVLSITEEKAVQPIDEEGEEQDGENGAENNENGDENGGQAADEPGTSKEGDGNNEEAKKKGKGKGKEMRMELSSRSSELTSKIHKMAEEIGDRFGKGENATNPNEEELIRTLNEFTTDIGQNVTARRVGIPFVIDKPGALDRKDNQFSIEDVIYRKVSKDFEEGSARSFISNEVLMNKHGNFMILHNHWPGQEPQRPLPSLCKHLMGPSSSQNEHLLKVDSVLERAQCEQPSEYPLLTQICADETENGDAAAVPIVDFHFDDENPEQMDQHEESMDHDGTIQENVEIVEETVLYQEEMNGAMTPILMNGIEEDGDLLNDTEIRNAKIDAIRMETDENEAILDGGRGGNENGVVYENGVLMNGEDSGQTATGLKGNAFGPEMAQKENLVGEVNSDGEGPEVALIDEELLPPTQANGEVEIVAVKNTQVEDNSHWKGLKNMKRDAAKDAQTPMKKTRAKRKAASAMKLTTKRQPGGALMDSVRFNSFPVVEDICWIPGNVVSAALKKAIGAQIPQLGGTTARKKLQFDAVAQQFSPRKLGGTDYKWSEALPHYDPLELLRARLFFRGNSGIWAYKPNAADLSHRNIRHIPLNSHRHPFGDQSLDLKTQCDEFTRAYFELCAGDKNAGDAEVPGCSAAFDDGQIPDGDSSDIACSPGGHVLMDTHQLTNSQKKAISRRLDDGDGGDLDTGFGFLNNITFREIVLICQNNFNVHKVKAAILKVLSSRETVSLDALPENDEMDERLEVDSNDNDESMDELGDEEDDGEEADHRQQQGEALFAREKISSRELFAQLPSFLRGTTKKNLSVISAFAVLLHLCNDKQFTLTQPNGGHNGMVGQEQDFTEFIVNLAKVPERKNCVRARKRPH